MHIKKMIGQNRRDFTALYECEYCGHTETSGGYDDDYFHQQVIPNMRCGECREKAGKDFAPRETKYSDDKVV